MIHTHATEFEAIAQVLPEPCFLVSAEGEILAANDGAAELLGLGRDALEGRMLGDFVTQSPSEVHTYLHQASRTHDALPGALTWRTPGEVTRLRVDGGRAGEGSEVFLRCRVGADACDEFALLTQKTEALVREISERQRIQAALSQTQRRVQAIFDHSHDAMFLANDQARYQEVNQAACALTGYTREELLRMGVADLTPASARGQVQAAWESFLRAGTQRAGYKLTRKGGSEVDVEYTAVAHILPGTHLAIIRDTSERVRAEQERQASLAREQRARADAERSNRAKDEFLAVLSHELRTPLSPVLLTLSSLTERANLPEDLRVDVAEMLQNVQLEARLIDDLLDLTRISKGKFSLHWGPADVHELIEQTVTLCCADGRPPLPQVALAAASHRVRADAARLQQVIWNLLSNARKFTPADGQIWVRTRNVAAPAGETLEITVSDTGRGIDRDFLGQVFDAFAQDETHGRQFGGLGLGLAIARAIIEAHQGRITVDSPGRGHGATFTVALPTAAPAVAEKPGTANHDAEALGEPAAAGRCLRVLLVEDHAPTARVLARLLRQEGHRVEIARTLAEARQRLGGPHSGGPGVDLVISDLGLPDGSGYEVAEHLRGQEQAKDLVAVPAIALSGYGMEDDVARAHTAGFSAHLTKPVSFEQLRDAIAQVTDATTRDRQGNGSERSGTATPGP